MPIKIGLTFVLLWFYLPQKFAIWAKRTMVLFNIFTNCIRFNFLLWDILGDKRDSEPLWHLFCDPCNIKIITELTHSDRYKVRKAWTNTALSLVFCKRYMSKKYRLIGCLERSVLRYSGRRPTSPGKENRPFMLLFSVPPRRKINKHRVMTTGLGSTWHSKNYKIKPVILANGALDTCHSTRRCLFQPEDYYNVSLGFSFSSYRDIVSDSANIN